MISVMFDMYLVGMYDLKSLSKYLDMGQIQLSEDIQLKLESASHSNNFWDVTFVRFPLGQLGDKSF